MRQIWWHQQILKDLPTHIPRISFFTAPVILFYSNRNLWPTISKTVYCKKIMDIAIVKEQITHPEVICLMKVRLTSLSNQLVWTVIVRVKTVRVSPTNILWKLIASLRLYSLSKRMSKLNKSNPLWVLPLEETPKGGYHVQTIPIFAD